MARPLRKTPPRAAPGILPVLPVRDNVHFPLLINTLLVGREVSVRALDAALKRDRRVLVVGQRDMAVDDPVAADLYSIGTLSELLQVLPMPDGTRRGILRGLSRVRIQKYQRRSAHFVASYEILPELISEGETVEAAKREVLRMFHEVYRLSRHMPAEALEAVAGVEEAGRLADSIAHHLHVRPEDKQALLEEPNVERRLEVLLDVLLRESHVLELQTELHDRVERDLGKTQRQYLLREQLRAIHEELEETDPWLEEGESYRQRIAAAGMPAEVEQKAFQELARIERAPPNSQESLVMRTYLDLLVELPWSRVTEDRLDVARAAKVLDRDHYGLTNVKERILEFLAVRQLNPAMPSPILCLVGPPGVGKTSVGRSIAEALGREFVRVSLGGVRDEAEIRGHRRTYVGSMPGRLIQGIKGCGVRNPVFMLDEIDKLGSDFRGDPKSALLEALDPEQNRHFSDHYLEVPFDLSDALFICTANLLEPIPPALRDRMEIIAFPSYLEEEKLQIAIRHLWPKKRAENGLKPGQVQAGRPVLREVIRSYTREAGVRGLERELGALCRKAARKVTEGETTPIAITTKSLEEFLGLPKHRYGALGETDEIGAATGLVYTEAGGDTLRIEVSLSEPYSGEPRLALTGSLGEVMKESAMAAMTFVRSNQARFSTDREFRFDVHVHVPEGAIPKDGPSAGITIATALISAFTGTPVRRDVAMTGEITLRGNVLPIGGLREKVLGAHRAGVRDIILPRANAPELSELPQDLRATLRFHLVDTLDQALKIALAR